MTDTDVAIIGAGPLGLEAGVAAAERGLRFAIFERAQPGHSVRCWHHVRMFSPFQFNSSARGRQRLADRGQRVPPGRQRLRAGQFIDDYLLPLAATLPVHRDTEALAIRHSANGGGPRFELAMRSADRRWTIAANHVIDCAGTFDTPSPITADGTPLPGLDDCREALIFGIPDVAGALREQYGDRRTLVIGSGYSAATVVRDLCALRLTRRHTRVIWISRRGIAPPLPLVPKDPFEAREALARHVNDLVRVGEIDFRPAHVPREVRRTAAGIEVFLRDGRRPVTLEVDQIVAAVGFRPNPALTDGLALAICPATESVAGLAAFLARLPSANHAMPHRAGIETLRHPEPGYFRLGSKSFGRLPGFLIATGLHQIDAVIDLIAGPT